jgi:hypothetical protein
MAHIANFWTPTSPLSVRVFSNCQQVSLYLNNTLVKTQTPDALGGVAHPPFTFSVSAFAPGTLRADGLINGNVVASDSVKTPLAASKLVVTIDSASWSLAADGSDLAVVYAAIADANGTTIPTALDNVTFTVSGPGAVISGDGNPASAVAGIAAVYVQSRYNTPGLITVTASAPGLLPGRATIRSIAPQQEISFIKHTGSIPLSAHPVACLFQRGKSVFIEIPNNLLSEKEKPRFTLYDVLGHAVKSWNILTEKKILLYIGNVAHGSYLGQLNVGTRHYSVPVTVL